ncbi:MAG: DPP IV N-terminal domain-containing protein [Bacteroidales bacterium]|jgi:dipeptidyl-peptidase-4
MIKKRIFSSILFLTVCIVAYNQYFTVEDIETGRGSYLKPDDLDNLQWNTGSGHILFSKGDSLFETGVMGENRKVVLTLETLNKVLNGHKVSSFSGFPLVKCVNDQEIAFQVSNGYILFDLQKTDIAVHFDLPAGADNLALAPNAEYLCYTSDNNVWIQDRYGVKWQVTFDSLAGITNGEVVYRNEFGMERGISWSPKGNYLAYYRRDQSQVSTFPLIDISTRPATTRNIRYPMAGMKSEETGIWIYSPENKSYTKLQVKGDPEQYLTNLSWTPDETAVYLQQLNRDQDTMRLKSYAVQTGEFLQELFLETEEHYVEPLYPLIFSGEVKDDFFYQSSRNGYNHIYYYDSKKRLLKNITNGNWDVSEFIGFDKHERIVYFMAGKDNPLENHCYRLNRDNGEMIRLTKEEGTHEVQFNDEMTYFIDRYSGYEVPNAILLCNQNGKETGELLRSGNPAKEFKLGEVERGVIRSADGITDLHYRLIKPVEFDPVKKYPVLVYVYGGPHVQLLTNSWMDRIEYFQQYMAQQGFVSFTLDSRGSWNRGKDFENIVYRQLGVPQLADQMKGVEFLRSLTYVDSTRIGVHGWSFGGFMTVFMMLRYPETFQTGVAGGPVIDWKYYEVMYTERYMDKPAENPRGYDLTDLTNYAGNLKGDLLVIHGLDDPTVVWQQSLLFLQSCISSDIRVDFFVYPGHEHNISGEDRVHLTRKISEYFIDRLLD